jgi:putative aldouronate transport system substrate-binding protein
VPATGGPKPNYPADNPQLTPGFSKYPSNPAKALPNDPPGTGSSVSVFSRANYPLPTPYDQNPAWQAVNKALNANVQFTIPTFEDYPAKLSAIMAGNDLPDIIGFFGDLRPVSTTLANVPGGYQFLQAKAADLTPYLAGDAIKAYPNLAAIPTYAWANAGCAYQGKLYMVPQHRGVANAYLWLKNATIYAAEIGADYVPKNADDFKRILRQLTRPQQNLWGTGGTISYTLFQNFGALFGAPNEWRLESNGSLTRVYETAEFKEAVGYMRDLWSAGVFHPDSPSMASLATNDAWHSGKFAIFLGQFNTWQDDLRAGRKATPPIDFKALPPFAAHDGQKPNYPLISGYGGAIAVMQGSPDRIKELLRIADWLAAPFGSAEDLLITYGVQETDYTFDADGALKITDRSNQDANYVPWKYVGHHPFVFFSPDLPDYAGIATATERALLPIGVANPTQGVALQSATASLDLRLSMQMTDNLMSVMLGRSPMSAYDQYVTDWSNNGGDQIRKEFMAALANG